MESSEEPASLDHNLATHVKETGDVVSTVEKLQETMTLVKGKSFPLRRGVTQRVPGN